MKRIIIPVEGMTCGGCVKSIERALLTQSGVSAAKASLDSKNVAVDFDAALIDRPQLESAIHKAGFTVPA